MATCVLLPLGPACVNLDGVRAPDRVSFDGRIKENGVPLDCTGLTLRASARKRKSDTGPAPIIAVCTWRNQATGDYTITFPGSQVEAALGTSSKWNGFWDAVLDNGLDDPAVFVEGTFLAEWGVTR